MEIQRNHGKYMTGMKWHSDGVLGKARSIIHSKADQGKSSS